MLACPACDTVLRICEINLNFKASLINWSRSVEL